MTNQSHHISQAAETRSVPIRVDGSEDAKGSTRLVARLMPGPNWTVLTMWKPLANAPAPSRGPFGILGKVEAEEEIDDLAEAATRRITDDRISLTCKSQPDVVGLSEEAADAPVDEAREPNTGATMLGSNGLSGGEPIVPGSVPHRIDWPELVVSSSAFAASRAPHRHGTDRSGAQSSQ